MEILTELWKDLEEESFIVQPHQLLKDVGNNFATSAGIDAAELIVGFNKVFSCENVHSVWYEFKEPLCCNIFPSVATWLLSWYLIPFSLFFCGIWSNCCGAGWFSKKRKESDDDDDYGDTPFVTRDADHAVAPSQSIEVHVSGGNGEYTHAIQ